MKVKSIIITTILVILAIAMEFVTQKLKVKNEVKQNGEFN